MTNNTMYSQAQLEAHQQPQVEARQKALEADPGVQTARRTLEKATADYEQLQSYVKGLKLEQRLGYNGNVAQAKENVTAAEKALREATNAHYRRDHLSKLAEKKQAQEQQREAEQAQFAAEQEATAKREFQAAWVQSGGTFESFEQAWKTTIWPKELEARAAQQVGATQRVFKQAHAYSL